MRLRLAAIVPFIACSAMGITSTNIQDIYTAIRFDPTATNAGVIIQLTDTHFCTRTDEWHQEFWNDPAITNMINAMPRAHEQMVLVTGDIGMGNWYYGLAGLHAQAATEWQWAKNALDCITNVDWIYVGPGNHDADNRYFYTGENPVMQSVFHQPLYTNFTVAGMPVIYLNGLDVSYLDPGQKQWLQDLKPTLDKNKEIILATHQNPWGNTLSGPNFILTREICRDAEWFMRGWRSKINWLVGHTHANAYVRFPFESTSVRLWYGPPSRAYSWFHTGFMVYCITNGAMAGSIIAFSGNETNYTLIDLNNGAGSPMYFNITYPYIRPWQEAGNVLWRVEEGGFYRTNYAESFLAMTDAKLFVLSCRRFVARLPGDMFPLATRALVGLNFTNIAINGTNYPVGVYLSSTGNNWTMYPIGGYTNFIARVDIPTELRGAPIWMMVTNTDPTPGWGWIAIAGMGLGTTNTITDFEAWCGRELGDCRLGKDTEVQPGITAWTAFAQGLNIRHMDTTEAIDGYPWVGGWPLRTNDVLLIPTRTNLTYTFKTATTTNGPWSDVTVTNGVWTNGWRQVGIYPAGTNVYKIEASPALALAPAPPVLTVQKGANGQLIISYTGVLQSADSPDGPWNDYADATQSLVIITPGQGAKFFHAASY